jgi:hypothetical protein
MEDERRAPAQFRGMNAKRRALRKRGFGMISLPVADERFAS